MKPGASLPTYTLSISIVVQIQDLCLINDLDKSSNLLEQEMSEMVMTILEAHVSKENWATLGQAFQSGAQQRDAGLEQSFLVQSKQEGEIWRIITIWHSQAALDAMRSSGETPRGVVMFRTAQAEPTLSIFEIVQHIAPE